MPRIAAHPCSAEHTRHQHQKHRQSEDQVSLPDRTGEAKAQSPITRVVQPEPVRLCQHPGQHCNKPQHRDQRKRAEQMQRHLVQHQQQPGQQPSLQDRHRIAVIGEPRPVQVRVAIEVLKLAHLGPCRIDPHGRDRQQQVDDPDPEVFLAGSGELHATGARCGCRRRFAHRRMHIDHVHPHAPLVGKPKKWHHRCYPGVPFE